MKVLIAIVCAFALANAAIPIPNRLDGFTIGNSDAPVVLEVFGDTMCPDTKGAYPTIRQVADAYGPDKLRLVFHALSLPYTHVSWLTNYGLWVVAGDNPNNAYPYIELIFANQDSYWNHLTADNTTNQIIASVGNLVAGKGFMTQAAFIAGMNNATISFTAETSWKYIVTRGVASTPTFFVNGVLVEADPSWTVADWQEVLDPLFSGPSKSASVPTCNANQTLCQYLPGKYECCNPTIYCIPNVGCECSEERGTCKKPKQECSPRASMPFTQTDGNCPSGEQKCEYLPGKFQCCLPGEMCIKNVGCSCLDQQLDQPTECSPRAIMPITQPNSSCPSHEQSCQYLPGKYQCCLPGEECIKNVGCSCLDQPTECSPRAEMPFTQPNGTCPTGDSACEYLPGKYQCCLPGEFCIKNVGCSCLDEEKEQPAECASRIVMPYTQPNSSCPSHEQACQYLPGKYQCCLPGEECIKNVGCSCLDEYPDEPTPCASQGIASPIMSAPKCPAGEKACQVLPGQYQCCMAGDFCIPNVGCTCLDDNTQIEEEDDGFWDEILPLFNPLPRVFN